MPRIRPPIGSIDEPSLSIPAPSFLTPTAAAPPAAWPILPIADDTCLASSAACLPPETLIVIPMSSAMSALSRGLLLACDLVVDHRHHDPLDVVGGLRG